MWSNLIMHSCVQQYSTTALFNTFYIFSADFCVKLSGENASVESLWAS